MIGVVGLGAALFVLQPGGRRVNPEGPKRLPPPTHERTPLLSSISAPVAIPLSELDTLVNEVVPVRLYQVEDMLLRKGIARARLDLKVRRTGRIYLETRDGSVVTHIPLKAEGSVRALRITRPFETTFTIHAVTALTLDTTWTTQARTRGRFTWNKTPSIKLLGITINLKKIAGKALESQLTRLTPRIDRLIEDKANLRPRMERIWTILSEPIAVQKEPPIWLQVHPSEVFYSPAESSGDSVVYGLRLKAFVETVVGARPAAVDLGSLPPLRPLTPEMAQQPDSFRVNVPLTISYKDAEKLLSKAVAEKDYDVQDVVSFKVKDISVYGHLTSLVARLDFSATTSGKWMSTRGRVFMTGKTVYDRESRSVRVDSFNYDVNSEDALVNAADWALRDNLLEQVRERLVLPLSDHLDLLQVRLQGALNGRVLGRVLMLESAITELEPSELYLTPDGLGVDVHVRGHLGARLHGLSQVVRPKPAEAKTP